MSLLGLRRGGRWSVSGEKEGGFSEGWKLVRGEAHWGGGVWRDCFGEER